jgi:hypothetical protein
MALLLVAQWLSGSVVSALVHQSNGPSLMNYMLIAHLIFKNKVLTWHQFVYFALPCLITQPDKCCFVEI